MLNLKQSIEIADSVYRLPSRKTSLLILKDHKDNFENNSTCRLINPAKTEIGKISKRILDNFITNILSKTKFNLKNTNAVLQWFINISNPLCLM